MRRFPLVLLVSVIVGWPSAAPAQSQSFLLDVRELAEAVAAGDLASTRVARAIARAAASLREWDASIATFEDRVAREVTPSAPDAARRLRETLALMYLERGRFDDALRVLDALIDGAPSDVHLLRAYAFDASGRPDAAVNAIVAAWEIDPRNPVKAYHVVQRAPAHPRAAAYQALTAAYRALLSVAAPKRSPFPVFQLVPDTLLPMPIVGDTALAPGLALLAAHRFDEAVAALQAGAASTRAAATSPRDHLARGRNHELMNRVAEARRDYEQALTGALSGRSLVHVAIGRLALVDGDATGAIEAFQSAARLDPNNPLPHKELASALAAHDRPDEAFAELVAALMIDPRDAHAHAAIGQLFVDTDRLAEAVTAFTRALDLAPERYEIRYALATALTRLGRHADAERERDAFERARQQMQDRRRRAIAAETEREGTIRQQLPDQGGAVR